MQTRCLLVAAASGGLDFVRTSRATREVSPYRVISRQSFAFVGVKQLPLGEDLGEMASVLRPEES